MLRLSSFRIRTWKRNKAQLFMFESGSTRHIMNEKNWILSFVAVDSSVQVVNDKPEWSYSYGTVKVVSVVKETVYLINLLNVAFSPEIFRPHICFASPQKRFPSRHWCLQKAIGRKKIWTLFQTMTTGDSDRKQSIVWAVWTSSTSIKKRVLTVNSSLKAL